MSLLSTALVVKALKCLTESTEMTSPINQTPVYTMINFIPA